MIEVKVNSDQIQAALQELLNKTKNLKPALEDIGEYLMVSTRKRFKDKEAPDGSSWAQNSPLTQLLKRRDDPLIGESGGRGGLLGSFHYNARSNKLEFSNNKEYAAVQQFGAKQGQFGLSSRNTPLPWGNIPARPFLGISNSNQSEILDLLKDHIANALN